MSSFISKPFFKISVLDAFLDLGIERKIMAAENSSQADISSKLLLVEDNELNLEISRTLMEGLYILHRNFE